MDKFELMNRLRKDLNIQGNFHANLKGTYFTEEDYLEIKEYISELFKKIDEKKSKVKAGLS